MEEDNYRESESHYSPGYVSIPPLDKAVVQRFINAIKIGTVFRFNEAYPRVVNPDAKRIRFTFPQNQFGGYAHVLETRLIFERPARAAKFQHDPTNDEPLPPERFSLTVIFDQGVKGDDVSNQGQGRVRVIHSEVSAIGLEGGVRSGFGKESLTNFTIPGSDFSSVQVFVPNLLDSFYGQGIVVCPRQLPVSKQQVRGMELADTGYRVKSAVFTQLYGTLESKVITGLEPGVVRADIRVSPGLPRSESWRDWVYERDPLASVSYRPMGGEESVRARADANGNIIGAIELNEMLQLPRRDTRYTVFTTGIWIQPVDLKLPQPLRFKTPLVLQSALREFIDPKRLATLEYYAGAKNFGVDVGLGQGPCYLVMRAQLPIQQRMVKEELHIPRRLQ